MRNSNSNFENDDSNNNATTPSDIIVDHNNDATNGCFSSVFKNKFNKKDLNKINDILNFIWLILHFTLVIWGMSVYKKHVNECVCKYCPYSHASLSLASNALMMSLMIVYFASKYLNRHIVSINKFRFGLGITLNTVILIWGVIILSSSRSRKCIVTSDKQLFVYSMFNTFVVIMFEIVFVCMTITKRNFRLL